MPINYAMILLLAVGSTWWSAVWAQSRWYHVEVLVFRNTAPGMAGGEQWPDLPSLPDFRDAQRLLVDFPSFSDEPTIDGETQTGSSEPIAFESLSKGEKKLGAINRALTNSGAYEVMMHVAWRQPGSQGSRPRGIYLSDRLAGPDLVLNKDEQPGLTSTSAQPYVEGIVRLRVARLLHIDTDFVFYSKLPPVRLTESRNVKLKEIHYFDHPLFGVLVQVTPYHRVIESPADGEVVTGSANTP